MPNLSLLFHVYSHGFDKTDMKTGAFIGHREGNGEHKRKFTKRHYLDACQYVKQWMCDYNAMIGEGTLKQPFEPVGKDRELDVRISTPPVEMKKIKTGLKSVGKIGPPTLKKVMAPANKDRSQDKKTWGDTMRSIPYNKPNYSDSLDHEARRVLNSPAGMTGENITRANKPDTLTEFGTLACPGECKCHD